MIRPRKQTDLFIKVANVRPRKSVHRWLARGLVQAFFTIVFPLALSGAGLPVGVQIIGRPFEDELVLDVAEELEKARGDWEAPGI